MIGGTFKLAERKPQNNLKNIQKKEEKTISANGNPSSKIISMPPWPHLPPCLLFNISKLLYLFKHATSFNQGWQPEVVCFPIWLLHTSTFILLSIFSLVETLCLKIWEKSLSCHARCSPLVSVRGSKVSLAWALYQLPVILKD